MGDRSGIEWTDATWNPTTGCDQVSPGCDHCYALTLASRLKAMGSPAYQQDGDPRTSGPGFALQMHEDRLDQPLRWTKPRRVFVNSMSDLFHPKVTDEFIARVFAVMALAEQHTFQVLTKRPKRMRSLLNDVFFRAYVEGGVQAIVAEREGIGNELSWIDDLFVGLPLRNVWLGTSVEDQQRADERIPPLLDTPAAVRFLSCEPLLSPVDLRPWLPDRDETGEGWAYQCQAHGMPECTQDVSCPGIQWVIVGGESGSGARPMHAQWARNLRDQTVAAGVAFFFKQWGEWGPGGPPATGSARVGKHAAGRVLDGRTWDEFPEAVVPA